MSRDRLKTGERRKKSVVVVVGEDTPSLCLKRLEKNPALETKLNWKLFSIQKDNPYYFGWLLLDGKGIKSTCVLNATSRCLLCVRPNVPTVSRIFQCKILCRCMYLYVLTHATCIHNRTHIHTHDRPPYTCELPVSLFFGRGRVAILSLRAILWFSEAAIILWINIRVVWKVTECESKREKWWSKSIAAATATAAVMKNYEKCRKLMRTNAKRKQQNG